jgi:hypothetical protein
LSLFKYMSAAVGMLFTNTLRIRFTQPFDLNDPFEFRPMLDFEATAAELREVVDIKLEEMIGTVDGKGNTFGRRKA